MQELVLSIEQRPDDANAGKTDAGPGKDIAPGQAGQRGMRAFGSHDTQVPRAHCQSLALGMPVPDEIQGNTEKNIDAQDRYRRYAMGRCAEQHQRDEQDAEDADEEQRLVKHAGQPPPEFG